MLPSRLAQLTATDPNLAHLASVLDAWVSEGLINQLERYTGLLCAEQAADQPATCALLGVSLSRWRRDGHVCLDLDHPPGFLPEWAQALGASLQADAIRATGLVGGPEDARRPFVIEASRIWIQRAWRAECRLAGHLARRLTSADPPSAVPSGPLTMDERQAQAVGQAMAAPLSVISGGPGTGKTTVAAEIIARLMAENRMEPGRVALAAPTGKAAVRLQTAVSQALVRRGLAVDLPNARTLHRLLRWSPSRRSFLHGPDHPLGYGLLVVDEASMVDLEMMDALLAALPKRCQLVLLGDRDQLASVAPGSVMADICLGATRGPEPGRQPVVLLERNYRFDPDSGLAAMAGAIRSGDEEAVLKCLSASDPDLHWVEPKAVDDPAVWLAGRWPQGYPDALAQPDPAAALAAADRFRVLCAHRRGPLGTERFNKAMGVALSATGVLNPRHEPPMNQLLLIGANDYRLGLFNGDVGLVRHDTHGSAECWFPGDPDPRAVPAARIALSEPAFAMTVHKSQGSEYEHVLLVLPEPPSPLLTRELFYTGATRARRTLTVLGSEAAIRCAVSQPTIRYSGLADRLWSHPSS